MGDGTLGASLRLGLSEVRNAVSLGPESVEAPTPLGMYGNITPMEVSEEGTGNEEPQAEQAAPTSMEELPGLREVQAAEASQVMSNPQGHEMSRTHGGGRESVNRLRGTRATDGPACFWRETAMSHRLMHADRVRLRDEPDGSAAVHDYARRAPGVLPCRLSGGDGHVGYLPDPKGREEARLTGPAPTNKGDP